MTLLIALVAFLFSLYWIIKIAQAHTGVVRWVFFEVIYNLFIKYLIGYLGLPNMLNYGSDLIMLIIVYLYLYHNERARSKEERFRVPRSLFLTVAAFFSVCMISWLINAHSPVLFAWGFRNNFRFLIFLMVCAATLKHEDVFELLDILFAYLVFNAIVVTHQNFTMSYGFGSAYGDYVSGLFSSGRDARGGNASLNWLLCIVSASSIVRYLYRDVGLIRVLAAIGLSLYIAALNETKLYFVQIAVIAVLALILAKKSPKTVLIAVVVMMGLFASIQVLYQLFPQFTGFFTLDNMLDYASSDSGYTRGGVINRFNSVTYVLDNFLSSPLSELFGVGLGNADYSSSFEFLTSSFYRVYGWTAYQWFSVPMLLVETGLVGLVAYFAIIANSMRIALVTKVMNNMEIILMQLSVIVGVIAVMMAICNQSLRLESMGFTAWLFLAVPFVIGNSNLAMPDKTERDGVSTRLRVPVHGKR